MFGELLRNFDWNLTDFSDLNLLSKSFDWNLTEFSNMNLLLSSLTRSFEGNLANFLSSN
jgi:hypothetical protein